MKKSFLVTRISNALGGYDDELVHNDELKAKIDGILESVFGSDPLDGVESDEEPNLLAILTAKVTTPFLVRNE